MLGTRPGSEHENKIAQIIMHNVSSEVCQPYGDLVAINQENLTAFPLQIILIPRTIFTWSLVEN